MENNVSHIVKKNSSPPWTQTGCLDQHGTRLSKHVKRKVNQVGNGEDQTVEQFLHKTGTFLPRYRSMGKRSLKSLMQQNIGWGGRALVHAGPFRDLESAWILETAPEVPAGRQQWWAGCEQEESSSACDLCGWHLPFYNHAECKGLS